MRELFIIPVALLLLSVASQLTATAETTSDKVVNYAEDMSLAMDCAILGKPLAECSPNLVNTDFSEDLTAYQKELQEIEAELNATIQDLEAQAN